MMTMLAEDIRPQMVRQFVNHYRRQPGDALRAMRLAGFDGSDEEARAMAAHLLEGPLVKAMIDAPPSFGYVLEDVLHETAEIAFAPWKDFVKVKVNKDGDTIAAMMDMKAKMQALTQLGEFFGAWGARRGKRPKNPKDLAKLLADEIARVNGGTPASMRLPEIAVREAEDKQPS